MKRYGHLWEQLVSFENVFLAFRKAIRGKGYRPYTLYFIQNLEHNLIELQHSLKTRNYRPGGYRTFFIHEPKRRMISEAPFTDRIVHHCLINVIGPIFEATFIRQSYANQIGKGTHRAIREVQNAMRLHRFVLHCDIRKYFPSIDHQILKGLIRRKIKDPEMLWLTDLIIDSSNPQEPVIDCFLGDDLLAPHDRRKGLPIGNLTSQFFANVYLNGFDHFVKEKLGCRFYARYVDDMIVVDSDKDYLWEVCREMGRYLETLRLRLHPGKCHIRPVAVGLRFLGQRIYPNLRLLPKSNVRRFMQRLWKFHHLYAAGAVSLDQIRPSVQSWLGHAKQAHTLALRQSLLEKVSFRRNIHTLSV
jgi:RNA-directed DNA polymerase